MMRAGLDLVVASSPAAQVNASAHAVRVKRVSQKNADAEKEAGCHNGLDHSLAPWLEMPGRAARRNWW